MSKYSLFLISRLVIAVLATGIVIAQIDLNTTQVISPRELNYQKLVSNGLLQYRNLCEATHTNADTDFMVPYLLTGSIRNESDSNAKCFFRCMLEMVGATDSNDGQFDPKQTAILFTPPNKLAMDNVQSMSAECNKKQGKEDLCDEAYHFMQCVMKKILSQYGVPKWASVISNSENYTVEPNPIFYKTTELPLSN